jgi:predicted transcriptional regulator
MNRETKTLHEVKQEGIRVLMKNLGPADAIRFLRQYDRGYGDYTAERHKLLGHLTREQILREIRGLKRFSRSRLA